VTLERVAYHGYEGVRLRGGRSSVVVVTSAGPRVLGLIGSGEDLFAVLPAAGLDGPAGERFAFIGGHRLWAAPEVPDITYQPDDRPCAVVEVDDGVRVEAPADGAGLAKAIEVRASGDDWVVDHAIRNASGAAVTIAPWAITQLRPGGRARLPLGGAGTGLQADHALVLWPYTRPDDPRLGFEPDAVRIRAEPGPGPIKVGAAPSRGRVSYERAGERFEKRVELDPAGTYADRGAAVQVYLNDDFCELETLGPLRVVEPGAVAEHRERWTLGPAGGSDG
jgi:hypothetical protein